MNLGILTYYGVHNYGAVLQVNALQQVLKRIGHDVHFLSFSKEIFTEKAAIPANIQFKAGCGYYLGRLFLCEIVQFLMESFLSA